MAGVVPKRSASGRKQWSLQDGPRSSLKLLRNQLANEGCSESQVVLAKQLLENDQRNHSKSETKENERLGVYWLIKASQQGNVEATELLRTCLKTGKGISEYNHMDVKSCISMTQDEKLTRKAAKEIFASLSNGADYITTEQLQRKILAIDKNKDIKHPGSLENGDGELVKNEEDSSDSDSESDWTLNSDSTSYSEKLTEDHLVSAAVDYSQGHLPLITNSLCLTPPNLQALDNIPYVYRSILHPWLVLKIFYFKILKFLGKRINFLHMKSEIQILLLLLVYSFINSENTLLVLPTVFYYITFIFMVLTTCQMMQNQMNFSDFRLWSGLFLCYSGGSLNTEQAENQYIKNNLKPYCHFFIALLLNLVIYSIISEQWVPDSELTVISFLMTFITLISFTPKKGAKLSFDMTVLLSFAVNVLAKYPYDKDPVVTQGWRFLDVRIPTFASYIIGNGIEFCLNFRLILYAAIPVLFIRIASKRNWKGIQETLIPHCVTLSWLQICIISSQGATMYGLLRGVLGLVGVVMFLPLVGLTSVLLPAIALTKWIVLSNMIHTICIFVIISSIALLISWLCAQTRFRSYTAVVQVIMMLAAFVTIINMENDSKNLQFYAESEKPQYITWNIFQKFCHQPVWQDENIALAQLKCAELDNSLIQWDGYINDIKINSIKNSYKRIFEKLPKNVNDILSCYYGEKISYSKCSNLSGDNQQDCQILYNIKKISNLCSLEKFNEYTFEITVKMASGIWGKSPEITLIVENYFRNFTMQLKPNDHIWFSGKLFNNENIGSDGILGGLKPHVFLEEIGCHNCQKNSLTKMKMSDNNSFSIFSFMQYLYVGFKFILNALFNPVVVFK
ncbi:hypothetical protein HHI36_009084 [Cryptolaemus montrouzieri]|uniref:Wolframin n=1 Tax=Cryptolaemus montrouzieri TaxID=559131 RepID=A0ABD2MUD7_9CUCU